MLHKPIKPCDSETWSFSNLVDFAPSFSLKAGADWWWCDWNIFYFERYKSQQTLSMTPQVCNWSPFALFVLAHKLEGRWWKELKLLLTFLLNFITRINLQFAVGQIESIQQKHIALSNTKLPFHSSTPTIYYSDKISLEQICNLI